MPPNYFFTADQHFGHTNIIKHCWRPFDSPEHMAEILIENHNRLVRPGDTVYHLGDFAWKDHDKYLQRLNGQHFLLKGNHDHTKDLKKSRLFQKIEKACQIKIDGTLLWLSHFAHRVWPQSHYGALHLYGHSHGNLPGYGRSMDVGVDAAGFYPLHFEQIRDLLKRNPVECPDHHQPGEGSPDDKTSLASLYSLAKDDVYVRRMLDAYRCGHVKSLQQALIELAHYQSACRADMTKQLAEMRGYAVIPSSTLVRDFNN